MLGRDHTLFRVPRRRRRWTTALGILLLLAGALFAGGWLASGGDDRLPPGVEIAGVDVGSLTVDEARMRLGQTVERLRASPIVLVYEGGSITTSGRELGAEPQIDEALEQARMSRDRLGRLAARLGLTGTIELGLSWRTNGMRVSNVVRRIEREVERAPVPAGVGLVRGAVLVTPSRPGRRLDRRALRRSFELLPARLELPLREVEPRVGDAEAQSAGRTAEALLAQPPTVAFRNVRLELSPRLVARALRFRPASGRIEVSVDPAVLERPLRRRFGAFERPPQDASFRIEGTKAILVPARRGRELAVGRIASELVDYAGVGAARARFDVLLPELTTRRAKALRIRELVSEFTTPYVCCAPRVTNIQRAAQILDGTIIKAGARFSLNRRLGERTPERGFLPAPQIRDGRLEDAVGGGVSQIASTIYNAAFFAGLDLIAHTPHQFYISRYPMGREATISWGGPELIFRNDWPAAILVKVEAVDTAVTVRFYSSTLARRVETETGEPHNFDSAQTIRVANPSLPADSEQVVQSGGVQGFTVEYTRRVFRGKRQIRSERFQVRYDPENTIIEYGPPAEPAPSGESEEAPEAEDNDSDSTPTGDSAEATE